MSVAYLAEVADSLLAAGTAALAVATTGRALPEHRYVTHSEPAMNRCCDGQLTVHLEDVQHGLRFSTDPPQSCAILHEPTFVITLGRCWPTFQTGGADPTVSEWDIAAGELLEDLWALLTELADRIHECTLFPGQAACDDAEIVDALPLDAEGACAGWKIRVRLTTNDAGPTGS